MKKANKFLILGFLIWLVSNALRKYFLYPDIISILGIILFPIGYGLFIYGCTLYTRAKGYAWYVGLLGILNLLGLIILVILPNKFKKQNKPNEQEPGISSNLNTV